MSLGGLRCGAWGTFPGVWEWHSSVNKGSGGGGGERGFLCQRAAGSAGWGPFLAAGAGKGRQCSDRLSWLVSA